MSVAVKVLVAGGVLSVGLMGLVLFLPPPEPPVDTGWELEPSPAEATRPPPPPPEPGPRVRVAEAPPRVGLPVRIPVRPPAEPPELAKAPVPTEAPERREAPTLETAQEEAQQAVFAQERIDAVRWLGQHGGPGQHGLLRTIGEEDQSAEVRQEAEAALQALRGRFPGYDWDTLRGRPLPSGRGGISRGAQ